MVNSPGHRPRRAGLVFVRDILRPVLSERDLANHPAADVDGPKEASCHSAPVTIEITRLALDFAAFDQLAQLGGCLRSAREGAAGLVGRFDRVRERR
jgi:hypothetical protein